MGAVSKSPTYNSWASMKQRCKNKNHTYFHNYGGAGVSIVKEWESFSVFLKDMGIRPPGKSIDRIDATKPYGPKNCRWASRREQAINRKTTRWFTFRGKTKCLKEWATDYGIPYASCLYKRVFYRGWDIERALLTPVLRGSR